MTPIIEVLLVAGILLILGAIAVVAIDPTQQGNECEEYADSLMNDVPVKCLRYFGV